MIKAVLTDIEGTTSSISFVKDVLFPYARDQMAEFVQSHAAEAEVARLLEDARAEAGEPLELEALIRQLIQWIDQDRKVTPLKALQGMIWEAGYKSGAFTGHVYEDAVRNLCHWHEQGVHLYVFSSGSVQAQRVLFGYSDFGDLTPLFSGYFDTNVGSKRDVDAYLHIIDAIALPAESILFLSDTYQELDAAREAGMQTLQLIRDDSVNVSDHHAISSFDQINL